MGCNISLKRSVLPGPEVDPVVAPPNGCKALEHLTGDGIVKIDASWQDPRLPLNANDIFRLESSWKGVHREIRKTGVEMFIRLFSEEPLLRRLFVKHIPDIEETEDLSQNVLLVAHAEAVMSAIDASIVQFHDVETWGARLDGIGRMHRKVDGFTPDLFWKTEVPFHQAVKTTLLERFTPQMDVIYRKTYACILQRLEDAFKDNVEADNSNFNGLKSRATEPRTASPAAD